MGEGEGEGEGELESLKKLCTDITAKLGPRGMETYVP